MRKRSTRLSKLNTRNRKEVFIRRAKRTMRNIGKEKITKVSRLVILKSFKSDRGNFVFYARGNGKPVKRRKYRRDWMETTSRGNNNTSKSILDKLEAMNGIIRKTIKKRIAVVKLGGYESVSKDNCRRTIKGGADLTKLANMKKGRETNRRDMIFER